LKNFVKIRAAIERYGARKLRFLFLLYRYNSAMDYSDAVMDVVAGIEKPFDEFFQNVKVQLRA
jgi:cysteinyl-tRNA synthetase